MSWLVAVAIMATLVNFANSDAGHFFAETPKHLPRIGRRGDLPPLINLITEEDTNGNAPVNTMPEAFAKIDADGDGCISFAEILRIPIMRVAVLLQDPALIAPHIDYEDNASGDDYNSKRRPQPRLIRYLKK
ncbi:hypothetical protein SK128_026118 [Halocaridina rubra]|uniref:EF-hand domain-containing protein n=1 Tax=Halocaridina rubra TaxID=373956 RepID=A0AAN9A9T5_HALRR